MRHRLGILICFLFLFLGSNSFAQFKAFGFKTGVNYGESVIKETFTANGTDFTYASQEADVAMVWGMFARAKIKFLFFQPEILGSDHQTTMKLSSVNMDSVFRLKQNRIDIPLLIGYSRKDKIRAYMGPVYTKMLSQSVFTSDFYYDELPEIFIGGTWGYQLGFGFDMGPLMVDARFETSLGLIGNKVTLKGNEYHFDHRMNTVQVTVGWDLIH